MKPTHIFAISAFAIAIWIIFSSLSRRDALAANVNETNQRPLASENNLASPHAHRSSSVDPSLEGSAPTRSKRTRRPDAAVNQDIPVLGSDAAGEEIPVTFRSGNRFRIQTSPKHFSTDPYQISQPAALVDMGDLVTTNSARDSALQGEAERLATILSSATPATDRASDPSFREKTVAASDFWFRQRYGGTLWMQHHIQAHHLAASARAAEK